MKINKTTVLTVLGGVGVIATVVLAVRGTPEAVTRIEMATEEKNLHIIRDDESEYVEESLTPIEIVKETWDCYIPALVVGAATLTCIFGANVLSRKQQATLASAYALVNEAGKEYRRKIREVCGEDTDEKVRNEIAKEYLEEGHKCLFYDVSGIGYFESAIHKVITDDGLECFILDIEPSDT